jgi:hypothetical protein
VFATDKAEVTPVSELFHVAFGRVLCLKQEGAGLACHMWAPVSQVPHVLLRPNLGLKSARASIAVVHFEKNSSEGGRRKEEEKPKAEAEKFSVFIAFWRCKSLE